VATADHGTDAPEALDPTPSVLFSCSLSGTVLATGAALGRLTGRTPTEVSGAPAQALLDKPSFAELQHVLRSADGGATSGSATFRLRHADGSAVEVPTSWSVLSGLAADSAQVVFVSAGRPDRRGLPLQEPFGPLSREVTVVVDAQGTVLHSSPAVAARYGYAAEDVVTSDVWCFVHPDDVASARAGYGALVADRSPRTTTLRIRDVDGNWRWVDVVAENRLDDAVAGVVCTVQDITAEVEAKRAMRAAEARFRAIADTSQEGIWVLSPSAETLYANRRMADILGTPPHQAHDLDLLAVLDPDSAAGLCGRLRTPRAPGPQRYEFAYAHPDGHERRLRVTAAPLHAEDGTHEGTVAMVSDITDVRRAEQELRVATLHDSLTRLPNRTLLVDRLRHALTRAEHSTAVLVVDLDHFRMVNDSRGHDIGDQLLIGVGARLLSAVSGRETVGRFGGDEFVIVCEDTDEQQAQAAARRLLDALTEPFRIDGAAVHVTASIGVAIAPAGTALSAVDLLRHADTAVHAAKSAGRGRVHVFEQTLGEDVEHRYALSADLRAALADDALHLEYQPVVDLRSGAVVGLEALARWTHPERGPVPPSSFVAVAELTGLAPELDRWVVRRAVRDMAALRGAGAVPEDAYVAVNLSASNLTDTFVFDDLLSWTEKAGLPSGHVVLEITETAIMQNTDLAVRLLRRLRDQGFRVAMDDFGTGYSSLAYLRDLPISALKIDRSFVADITAQQDALAIVGSIVDLARAVGVAVVAEGVETPEQAALLQRLGVVIGQGWLWSPSVPLSALLSGREWMSSLATASLATAGARTTRRWQRDVSVAHGLQRLLELHQYGASVATIAATLNAEGFRTPAGLRWHRTSVARVIAHQIRRCAGTPDVCASGRRAPWRGESAGRPPSRSVAAIAGPDIRRSKDLDGGGQPPRPSIGYAVELPGPS
jgi:diguanylate cyclase (GGDEF)-like protein/PAS domain S-box-containing protein